MLTVNEIFHSIQGESTHTGRPCVFVRLTGCDLRCVWCDTPYAFHEGRKLDVDEVVADVETEIGPNGELEIIIDTALAKEIFGDRDHEYTITAEARDDSRRQRDPGARGRRRDGRSVPS